MICVTTYFIISLAALLVVVCPCHACYDVNCAVLDDCTETEV